jgi:hypothetical protein
MLKNAASFIHIYIYTPVISVQVILQVTVQCDMFSVLFLTWEMSGIAQWREFTVFHYVATFVESKLISFTESGITR